jgi:hypothetical protein
VKGTVIPVGNDHYVIVKPTKSDLIEPTRSQALDAALHKYKEQAPSMTQAQKREALTKLDQMSKQFKQELQDMKLKNRNRAEGRTEDSIYAEVIAHKPLPEYKAPVSKQAPLLGSKIPPQPSIGVSTQELLDKVAAAKAETETPPDNQVKIPPPKPVTGDAPLSKSGDVVAVQTVEEYMAKLEPAERAKFEDAMTRPLPPLSNAVNAVVADEVAFKAHLNKTLELVRTAKTKGSFKEFLVAQKARSILYGESPASLWNMKNPFDRLIASEGTIMPNGKLDVFTQWMSVPDEYVQALDRKCVV